MTVPYDWSIRIGGDAADKWHEDRLRKAAKIQASADDLIELAAILDDFGAAKEATPAVLREVPGAAAWFIGLAGFAGKTLRATAKSIRSTHGMRVSPVTIANNLESGRAVRDDDVERFCAWINEEIEDAVPDLTDLGAADLAVRVAMIEGGRVLGQGQNEGGTAAVQLLKGEIVAACTGFADLLPSGEVPRAGRDELMRASLWSCPATGAELDFTSGGNRPDITVRRRGTDVLVGEVKGRKDLSNAWESWMPQVADHLHGWTHDHPEATRVVFMTVITPEMVEGRSRAGDVTRKGLRELHETGELDHAFNLSRMHATRAEFRAMIFAALGNG